MKKGRTATNFSTVRLKPTVLNLKYSFLKAGMAHSFPGLIVYCDIYVNAEQRTPRQTPQSSVFGQQKLCQYKEDSFIILIHDRTILLGL